MVLKFGDIFAKFNTLRVHFSRHITKINPGEIWLYHFHEIKYARKLVRISVQCMDRHTVGTKIPESNALTISQKNKTCKHQRNYRSSLEATLIQTCRTGRLIFFFHLNCHWACRSPLILVSWRNIHRGRSWGYWFLKSPLLPDICYKERTKIMKHSLKWCKLWLAEIDWMIA